MRVLHEVSGVLLIFAGGMLGAWLEITGKVKAPALFWGLGAITTGCAVLIMVMP